MLAEALFMEHDLNFHVNDEVDDLAADPSSVTYDSAEGNQRRQQRYRQGGEAK
ncbi:hypothetical protein JHK82_027556 [Glycine max]|nr:hypothetical protein JHK85_028210 [Glycine max]KAG5003545.1 hypothetical protein JHK86_027684 [Glycine max]KAG5126721.1 hypothetical protein JHK82_027556 [Glycine max]KAG5151334.1 hypothetical protein JHK84_027806 [Glycine max]